MVSIRDLSIRSVARKLANGVLSPFDLQLVRKSTFASANRLVIDELPPSFPPESETYLRWSNPYLEALRSRYARHPACVHSQWSPDFVAKHVDLKRFRADGAYVWQGPQFSENMYLMTAYYARTFDRLCIFDRLIEDGMFGAYAFRFNGKVVSRDLIDSVLEINFLQENFGPRKLAVLDIGAGYGRLGHRLSEAMPSADPVHCTDAVAESTFICDYYLRYRNARARAIPVDEVETLVNKGGIDLATNIHSFSECNAKSISWWLALLRNARVKYIFIVPNRNEHLLSREADGKQLCCSNLIAQSGYRLRVKRPKYANGTAMEHYGIGPTWYLLFELED
jgi:hypothetical protein